MSKNLPDIQEMTMDDFSAYVVGLDRLTGTSPDGRSPGVMVVHEGLSDSDEDIIARVRIV
jgi:hypothetical protein